MTGRKVREVLIFFLAIPAFVLMFNGGLELLSTPSDMAVFAGYTLLVALAAGSAYLALRWLRMARTALLGHVNGLFMGLVLAGMFMSTGCSKMVQPGNVGIVVKQTGSDRGVQDFPTTSGRVWYNPVNEFVLEWPTSVQRVIWTASKEEGKEVNEQISFQSKEGLHFTGDINAAYQMEASKVPNFYVKFRTDNMKQFTDGFFRDSVRNSFNLSTAYTAEEINGYRQGELIQKIQESVAEKMQPYGVNVLQIGFASPPRPPDQVAQAIENKVRASQDAERIQNEKASAIAEGEKNVATAEANGRAQVTAAKSDAESNDIRSRSITPALIRWKTLDKWDGKLPTVTSGGTPLINIGGSDQ